MEKGIQRGETQEIPWRTDPSGLRQDTYSKAVKLTLGLQSPVLLKMGGRRRSQMPFGLESTGSSCCPVGIELGGKLPAYFVLSL